MAFKFGMTVDVATSSFMNRTEWVEKGVIPWATGGVNEAEYVVDKWVTSWWPCPCPAGDRSLWVVPITITTQSSPVMPVKRVLMSGRDLTITLDVPEGEWVKVRCGFVHFYCVYDHGAMRLILSVSLLLVSIVFGSPWYDLRGWLGVKQQLSIVVDWVLKKTIICLSSRTVFLANGMRKTWISSTYLTFC